MRIGKTKMWKIKFFPHLLPFFDVLLSAATTTTGGANRSVTTTSKVQRHKSHATLAPIAVGIISFLFSSLWLARSLCSPASAIKDSTNTKIFEKRKIKKQKNEPPPLGKRSIPIILNTYVKCLNKELRKTQSVSQSVPYHFFLTKTTSRKRCEKGRTTTRYYINHFQISNKTLIPFILCVSPFYPTPKLKWLSK